MPIFSWLLRSWILSRLLGRGRRRGYGYGRPYRYARRPAPYGRGYRPRSRGGFFGPFPYWSGRTRGGSRVTVSGCCLPIPLTLALNTAAGARTTLRKRGARA